MAKARSPQYPAIGLKEAVEKVRLVWNKDYQNKVPKRVVAEHMGFKGLNGGSLPILAALGKYGLLEGRGDETRVSDLALTIIANETGAERVQAIQTAAVAPELFAELDQKFPGGKASDAALRSYLLTQKFIPAAADTAIRTYRETKQFVEAESAGYIEAPKQEPNMKQAESLPVDRSPAGLTAFREAKRMLNPPTQPVMREEFNLDEGRVTLEFPGVLSEESFDELAARFEIILRSAKRRARGAALTRNLTSGIDPAEAQRWSDAETPDESAN